MSWRILLLTALLLLVLTSPAAAVVGDLDTDGDIDVDDIAIILAAVNTPAAGPGDPVDLDSDGTITVLDARLAVTCCTLPLCERPGANTAPTLDPIGNQAVDELANLAFNATATDTDLPANTLTFSLDAASLAAGMTINGATGAFSWTPTEAQGPGVFSVTVTVTDDGTPSMSDSETFDVTVNEVNVAPVLGAIGNQATDELVNLAFNATATDADLPANTLTFSLDAASLAAGMTINPATGAFSWTPTEAQGPGVFSVTVTVTDDGVPAMSDSETFDITVNEVNVAPVLGTIGDQAVDELANLAFNATATDADLPANTLTFSLDAASLAAGMTINGATGAFSWTPTEAQGPGVFSVTVTVTDDGVPTMNDFETFDITVNELNTPPTVAGESFEGIVNTLLEHSAAPNTISAGPQVHVVGNLLANDSDADLPAQALTASLNSQATPGATITVNTDGTFTYVSAPGDVTGSDSFTYTVSDGNGGMTNGTVTINFFERVWYVQDNAAPGGLGRSSDPFDTLGEAETASLPNDFIFVFQGNTGTTPIDEGIALQSGQKLHGEGVGLSVDVGLNGNPAPTNLVAPNPGNEPEIDFTSGSAVTVTANAASLTNVEIRGLNLTGSNRAIDLSTLGANTLGVLIRDNVIGAAANEGVNAAAGHTGGLATVVVENNTVNATGNAFNAVLTGAGDLEVALNNNSLTSGGHAVNVDGGPGGGNLFVSGFLSNTVNGATVGNGVVILDAIFDSDTSDADFDLVNAGTTAIGIGPDPVGGAGMILGMTGTEVSGNLAFADLAIFNAAGVGLAAAGSGLAMGGPPPTAGFALVVPPSSVVSATGGPAVDLDPLTAAVSFSLLTSTGSPTTGVSLINVEGTFFAGPGSGILGNMGRGFEIVGGTVASTYSGNITQTFNASAVFVSGGHNTGIVTFDTGAIVASAGNGLRFDNADGTYNFLGTTTLMGGDAGVDILNGSGGTFTFDTNTTITNPTGTAFNATGSAANVTYSGTITQNNSAMGVNLASNTGTVTFRGALTFNTAGSTAFNATGGGVVNVCATDDCAGGAAVVNTIGATTALNNTALNISGTTIGANGVTFRSVSVNGASEGIILNNAGTGGFNVTGVGTGDGSGGTIQNITDRGIEIVSTDNISLRNIDLTTTATTNGADPTDPNSNCGSLETGSNADCHAAVHLQNVQVATLDNVDIDGSSQQGINARTVSDLRILNGDIRNVGDQVRENGITVFNASGILALIDTVVTFAEDNGLRLYNNAGTLNMTVLRATLSQNQGTNGNDGVSLEIDGGTANVLVDDSDFTNLSRDGVDGVAETGGVLNVTVEDSRFNNSDGFGGVILACDGASTINTTVQRNTITDNISNAVNLFAAGSCNMDATVTDNTISHPSVTNIGFGVRVIQEESSDVDVRVDNTDVSDVAQGMLFRARSVGGVQQGTLDVTIVDNDISNVSSTIGFQVDAGTSTGSHQNQVCLHTHQAGGAGNNSTPAGGLEWLLNQRDATVFEVQGLGATAIATFIQNNNVGTPVVGTLGTFTNAAANCDTPSATPLPTPP